MARPKTLTRVSVRDAVLEYREALERRAARSELSPTSLIAYTRDLDEFVDLVGADTGLDDIEADDIEKALTRIAQAPDRRYTRGAKIATDGTRPAGRSAYSRRRWFVSVRGLFAWAAVKGYVQIDPMVELKAPKVPKRAKGARLGIQNDDALMLRAAPAAVETPTKQQKLSLRDEAILLLLLVSGPRAGEVAGANRDGIRIHEETGSPVLRVVGKGGKPRDVPLAQGTKAAIDRYLHEERPAPPTPKDPHDRKERARIADAERALFVTVRGWRMTTRDIERLVERYSMATLGRRVPPHALRHTALGALARAGVDIATVADIAGHENLATTSIYIDKSAQAAAAAIDNSPLAVSDTRDSIDRQRGV